MLRTAREDKRSGGYISQRSAVGAGMRHEPISSTSLASEIRIGSLLASKYRLEALLGSGGMGDVYRALNVQAGRPVAIKVLHAEHANNPLFVERFLREARAANLVRHPNVVDVIDVGREPDGVPFIVQELLEGEDLGKLATRRGGKLPVSEVIELIVPVIEAVAEAHARGVIHRDLKPENVFLANGRNGPVPKLLDFGISKMRSADLAPTQAGLVMGTPAYIAPELLKGSSEADARSDVWALGILIFELVAGRTPFQAADPITLFRSILDTDAPRLVDVEKGVSPWLSKIVERALKRNREERYANATELADALRTAAPPSSAPNALRVGSSPDLLGQMHEAPPLTRSTGPRPAHRSPPPPKGPSLAGGAGVILLVLAIGSGTLTTLLHRRGGWPVVRETIDPGTSGELAIHGVAAALLVAFGFAACWRGLRHWLGHLDGGIVGTLLNAAFATVAFFVAAELAFAIL